MNKNSHLNLFAPFWRYCQLFVMLCMMHSVQASADVVAFDSFDYHYGPINASKGGIGWFDNIGWKSSSKQQCYVCDEEALYETKDGKPLGTGKVVGIHGTQKENVPMRRQLSKPYSGGALFVRFLFKYDAETLDDIGSKGDGEFFVLWLDDIDSSDGAGHTLDAPNIGIRIPRNRKARGWKKNHFMVRFSHDQAKFSKQEVKGDHTYLVVAKLSKTHDSPLAPYTRLELWLDPDPETPDATPDAIALGESINSIQWIGFKTGLKTEPEDFIIIDELALGERWEDVVPGAKAVSEKPNTPPEPGATIDFKNDVFPILQARCFDCHEGRDASAGHRLDVREELLGHYQGHSLAVPGNSAASSLIGVLLTDDLEKRMPLDDEPLTKEEIATLRAWVDQGLAWDENLLPSTPPTSDHWSFQQVERPKLPQPKNEAWRKNPVDAFIANEHEQRGIVPVKPAGKRMLLRRMTFDLTGLPATPEEVETFLADDSEDAVQKVIDRLLSSIAYGERWGRHWLDLARWGESDGYQQNQNRPHAWRYRDYVVNSFHENKKYDRFTLEQLAGDELSPHTDENIIATGFLASTRYSGNELSKAVQRNDILVDVTNTTSNAFLGLTMQCAQCHSHKFDPIYARDYYRFQGFFIKGQPVEVLLHERKAETEEEHEAVISAIDEQYDMIAAARSRIESSSRRAGLPVTATMGRVIGSVTKAQKPLFKQHDALVAKYDRTWAYYSPATSSTVLGVPYLKYSSPLDYSLHKLQRAEPNLLLRGDIHSPGPTVDVGWPLIFGAPAPEDNITDKPRTALANWITERENPLTARVWVNRIWLYHFGKGLVTSPDNFGTQGARPSHPELLDWLGVELMGNNWDTNHIHQLILTSLTYQQSSAISAKNNELDPGNETYWRWEPRRLEAEAIRDSMLAVSGLLDRTVGGPSVALNDRKQSKRRTMYLEQKRGDLPYVQEMFDAPAALACCGERRTSTVALQPLFLLNDPITYQYAEAFAKRVQSEAGNSLAEQVAHAFELALGRLPKDDELSVLVQYGESSGGEKHSLVKLCHSLLNLNEFLYMP